MQRLLTTMLAVLLIAQTGCAMTHLKQVGFGMAGGALVGAVAGHEFVHSGRHREYQTQNTVVTAIIFALVTGGVLAWHYQQMDDQVVEISSRYSRYRLCNPDELPPDLDHLGSTNGGPPAQLQPKQFQKYAISLDDNTKWSYPTFRKRFLPPERGETQVLSSRYIWEILKQGAFVTRSQNPEYFLEESGK